MEKQGSDRIWEIDFLRGFSIIMMVWDHLMYDLKSVPGWFANYSELSHPVIQTVVDFAESYWYGSARAVGHFIFVAIFLLVSGISFTFSRSNGKRALKFLVFALLISAVTMSVQAITGLTIGVFFGIIHMFALGTLITLLFRKLWDNNLFILTIGVGIVVAGVLLDWRNVPYAELTFANSWKIILGIKGYGADHFGLIPYTGVIMIGTVVGNLLYKPRLSLLPKLDGAWNKPFLLAGRHTLLIVVTHQPILTGLVFLIGYLVGYHI